MDSSVPAAIYPVVGVSLIVASLLVCGYVMNIFKLLFGQKNREVTMPVRVIGIFVPIVGCIIGWL